MLEALFRAKIQKVTVDSFATWMNHTGIKANHVTLMALLVGCLAGWALGVGSSWAALGLMWLSGYLDMVDGSLARYGTSSPFGAVLDIISDRLVESAIIVGLFWAHPDQGLLCLLMLASVLLCVTSFLVVGIFSENQSEKSFHYSPGLMERAEAFLFFTAMILMPHSFIPLAIVFIVLVLVTTVIRVYQFNQHCQQSCVS